MSGSFLNKGLVKEVTEASAITLRVFCSPVHSSEGSSDRRAEGGGYGDRVFINHVLLSWLCEVLCHVPCTSELAP